MARRAIISKNVWAAVAIALGITILTVAHLDQKAMQLDKHTELIDGAL